jgi:hypothetical protein
MKLLENKIIRIVEERGYMGTKYIPVIKEIISSVNKLPTFIHIVPII